MSICRCRVEVEVEAVVDMVIGCRNYFPSLWVEDDPNPLHHLPLPQVVFPRWLTFHLSGNPLLEMVVLGSWTVFYCICCGCSRTDFLLYYSGEVRIYVLYNLAFSLILLHYF